MPRTLATRGGTLYVFDHGDARLKAFDRAGGLRWRFGRHGEGPGEFANPLDVEVGPEGRLVEAEPFPVGDGRPIPQLPIWAVGIAVGDSSVFVLARGRTADALRLLDEYDARDGRYRRTLLLPRKASALAYADGIFYIEHEDPAPQILALRPVFE
jgi:hypothetical protein